MKVIYSAKWADGFRSSADANKVATEISNIGEDVTPKQIVDYARDSATELHKCFDWNDESAAEKYRMWQARNVINHLVFEKTEDDTSAHELRMFFKTTDDGGYKPTLVIMKNEDEYKALLERAKRELRGFQQKYKSLKELQPVFEVIDLL